MSTPELSPAQWALLGVDSGWTATAALDRFRAEGGSIANVTWYRLYGEIKTSLGDRTGRYNEPLNRIPVASEIKQWTNTRAKGYLQQVEVLVRDKATGEVISKPYTLATKSLVSRNTALKRALMEYGGDNETKYDEVILGAVYTGTYQMMGGIGA